MVAVEPGPRLIDRLRQALTDAPDARRFLITSSVSLPLQATETASTSTGQWLQEGVPVTVAALAVTDTCKEVVGGVVRKTVPRDQLADARGPWSFDRSALAEALGHVNRATIETMLELCRAAGIRARVELRP